MLLLAYIPFTIILLLFFYWTFDPNILFVWSMCLSWMFISRSIRYWLKSFHMMQFLCSLSFQCNFIYLWKAITYQLNSCFYLLICGWMQEIIQGCLTAKQNYTLLLMPLVFCTFIAHVYLYEITGAIFVALFRLTPWRQCAHFFFSGSLGQLGTGLAKKLRLVNNYRCIGGLRWDQVCVSSRKERIHGV